MNDDEAARKAAAQALAESVGYDRPMPGDREVVDLVIDAYLEHSKTNASRSTDA